MAGDEATEIQRLRDELAACREELIAARVELDVLGAVDRASGLPNRRGVIDAIEAAGERLDRTGEGYSVLHVSVPVLRTLDPADHLEGVRHVAALLTAALRGVDSIGRFDDASFVAVLADAGSTGVSVVAHRLSSVLGALPLRTGGGEVPLPLTCAAVVAIARPAPRVDELVGVLVDAALRARPGPEPVIAMAP
jgi:PleD family two-component response regulator